MMRSNEHVRATGAFFADFLTRLYVDAQAMRVRRQGEVSKGVVSLARLIDSISNNAEILTKERHVSLYAELYPKEEFMADIARSEFESMWGADASHVDPEQLIADLEELRTAVDPVKDFADKHVAHLDYTPVDEMPTFDELNAAMDVFGTMFSKYYLTLTGSSKGVSATIIDDWTVFAAPSVAELLDGHVTLDVECFDRLYLNAYIPTLQTSRWHRVLPERPLRPPNPVPGAVSPDRRRLQEGDGRLP